MIAIRRAVIGLVLVLLVAPARAHVGSPDVFYDGDAGPYPVSVTVRVPQVIPGVADIEIRTASPDATSVAVVSMRLSGPGSELAPTPDAAARSADDPQFFTASLWLMEPGSLKVRIGVDGARGHGEVSVPIPAIAQRTLGMDRGLGALLFGLMLVLALALVSIVGAAVRDSALEAGVDAAPAARRRAKVAIGASSVVVAGVLALGNWWWSAEASDYADQVATPWRPTLAVDGCALRISAPPVTVVEDHGHLMHLFVARSTLDRVAHLHPARQPDGSFAQALPPLPAGHYALFADVVDYTGFAFTGTGELDLPDLSACPPPTGDDALWLGTPTPDVVMTSPATVRAGVATKLAFRAAGDPPLHPYMGMAGHAMVVRRDLAVFAHLHPYGSSAMPAVMMAGAPHQMYPDDVALPPDLSFPYGFPGPGDYRVFVQIKRGVNLETAAFDVVVTP